MSSVKYQPFCLNLSVLNFHLHSEDNELISFCFGALSERSPICKSTGDTVGTPYNTTPYITGSNIARLGHGSQNSWSKLCIPIVKSAPVRVIFTWKSVPKKSIHGSSDQGWVFPVQNLFFPSKMG